jgi:hypothetical protein
VDLDCVVTGAGDIMDDEDAWTMLEFNYQTLHALIEYKDRRRLHRPGDLARIVADWKTQAIRVLADRAGLPFFLVFYQDEPSWFCVIPVGDLAQGRLASRYRLCTVKEYEAFLQAIRSA